MLLLSSILLSGKILAREFVPERPDKVRTAFTIVKGRFAIEPEILNYAIQEESNMHTFSAGEVFIRAGVTKNSELQINTDAYIDESAKKEDKQETHKSNGNTEFGWKYNLIGNDEGNYAIAVQPYLVIPTAGGGSNSDKRWEGGLALNWEWKFSGENVLGVTLEPNNVRKEDELDWQSSLLTAISLATPVFNDKLFGYIEFFNERSKNDDQPQITTLNFALQYYFSDRFMLDLGAFIGASTDANDLESFCGGSYLF